MKTKTLLLIWIFFALAMGWAAWYGFNFVSPVSGFLIIILFIIIVIYTPFKQIFKNEKTN